MIVKGILVHAFVFVGASVLALRTWTAPDEPKERHVGAELWSGRAAAVEAVRFSGDKKSFELQPQKDETGRYFVGIVTDEASPSTGHPKSPTTVGPDAGAAAPATPEPQMQSPEPKRFISVTQAQELVGSLATLRATRVLGKLEGSRLAEYGLEGEGNGKLTVKLGGEERQLLFGDKTPGGRDRYVLDPATQRGYVISGQVANDVTSAENRLVQREFHAFEEEEVAKVRIVAGDTVREVVRHPTKKNFWANAGTPESKEETVSNWMTKVERLRVTQYEEKLDPPVTDADLVVRVEYLNQGGRPLGFLEIVRRPPVSDGGKPRYVARSELSRWYATVLRSTAEQVDQDLGSVLSQ